MNEGEVKKTLEKIEKEVNKGNYKAVKKLGFWRIAGEVRKNPKLAEKFSEKIGAIDRVFFESQAFTTLDYRIGTIIELIGAIVGLIVLYLATQSQDTSSVILYLASAIILMTALHPIAHSIAGRFYGIGFHFYFLDGPLLIEPTLKVDYSTYMRAPAKSRAIFHLSGALNSVIVTFIVFLVALLDGDSPTLAKVLTGLWWISTTLSEIFPLFFTSMGRPKIFFVDFRKTDSYRALREWRLS